jgi:hypothetical protein
MSTVGIERFLESFDKMSNPTLDEVVKNAHIEAESLSPVPKEPNQTIALAANMTVAAIAGAEGCIDFFQASPFAIVAAARARKLALDPVVRVDIRTALIVGLLSELRSLVDKLENPSANEVAQ